MMNTFGLKLAAWKREFPGLGAILETLTEEQHAKFMATSFLVVESAGLNFLKKRATYEHYALGSSWGFNLTCFWAINQDGSVTQGLPVPEPCRIALFSWWHPSTWFAYSRPVGESVEQLIVRATDSRHIVSIFEGRFGMYLSIHEPIAGLSFKEMVERQQELADALVRGEIAKFLPF